MAEDIINTASQQIFFKVLAWILSITENGTQHKSKQIKKPALGQIFDSMAVDSGNCF